MDTVRDTRLVAVVVACIAIAGTAAAGGGYLPTAWGWAALGPAAVAAAALLLRRGPVTTAPAAAFGVGLVLLVAWTSTSLLWTSSVPRTVLEIERDLVYLALVGAILLLPYDRLALTAGIAAVCTAICAVGLATRLIPDRYGLDADTAYRLARPLGYWNALGAVAAIGALLAVGIAADARPRALRALASAAPVVLLPTLLLTQSRGSAIALVAGLALAVALHPARGRFALTALVVGIPAAVGTILVARSHELTSAPSSVGAAADDGHRVALALLVLAAASLAAPRLVDAGAPKLPSLPRPSSRATAATAIVVGIAGVLAAVTLGGKAYDAFRSPTRFGETGLRAHLLSLSGHDRTTYWRVALDDYGDHPALGSGAGTYDLSWTRERPFGAGALDAHNLYVETLAELGPLGLALLVAALGAPFAALASARAAPLVPALAGAYAAYLLHAAADWDWELPTLTLVGLACGALLAGSGGRSVRLRARPLLVAAAIALAAAAVVFQHGNDATARAVSALNAGRDTDAVSEASRASHWAPWDAEPWRIRADAERALGHNDAARRAAREATRKDPNDWTGWFRLALVTTGDERVEASARVRELNPLAPP